LSYIESKPQVTVYFQNQTKEKDILKLKDTVQASGKVQSVKYVSKQEALKIYRDLNKKNPLLLEMVSADILPPSLEIFAKEPQFLAEIAEYLKKQPGIDEVVFQKDIVDKLLVLTSVLRRISLFIFLFLLVISFVVLMTTTAFKIALKKEEIELMRLLGASTFYIKKPFLLEGTLFGLSSAVVSFSLFYLIFLYFSPFLNSYLTGIPTLSFFDLANFNLYVWPPSANFILLSFGLTCASGIAIGVVGNYLATSKYIK
jgi:cell division transport system permease protein